MIYCKICDKKFKTNWHLQRHLSKKMPCNTLPLNESSNTPDESSKTPDGSLPPPQFTPNESQDPSNESLNCKYCLNFFSRKDKLKSHMKICNERHDYVRILEIQLNIKVLLPYNKNKCKFCNTTFTHKTNHTRHLKTCSAKELYRKELEEKLRERQNNQNQNITNNHQTINNNNINILTVSAETLKKFGEESTDHITNAYLRRIIGKLEASLPHVVSTVAKQIYYDNTKPENQTLKITNVRSQWANVSNGTNYELQSLKDSVSDVRNKVTDLYVERQCDEPEYFKRVERRIEKLDDLNNQNFTAQTSSEKEEQKEALKLKADIEREVKSALYNLQKSGNLKLL